MDSNEANSLPKTPREAGLADATGSACRCWKDTDEKLRNQGFKISDSCKALILANDKLEIRHYLPLQRVTGQRLKRGDPHGISISFCPFCGRSLNVKGGQP